MSLWLPENARPPVPAAAPEPVLFLDRDGTVIAERHYLGDPAQVVLLPGVAMALREARDRGFRLVGLSNQSGIGRGHIGEADLQAVQARLQTLLGAAGCPLDAFFYCPHAPEDGCGCRKPAPGLLTEAAAHFSWAPGSSWLVGDKLTDVDLALQAGLGAVLVRTGYGATEAALLGPRRPVAVVDDLAAAVRLILAEDRP